MRNANIVLIVGDDHGWPDSGFMGSELARTPHLDALAAEGLVFRQARTVAPLTLPSHATMLTGLFPPRHGVRDNGLAALPRAATTLAERANERGFETAAFVGALVLDQAYGLAQGFERYVGPERVPGNEQRDKIEDRLAGEVVDLALPPSGTAPYEVDPGFRTVLTDDAPLEVRGEVEVRSAEVGARLRALGPHEIVGHGQILRLDEGDEVWIRGIGPSRAVTGGPTNTPQNP